MINRVTLIGHKDHGKSTLIGSMLIATKSVSEERINEAKKQSKKLGRKFEPGFMLDSFSDEREGGLTIDTSRAQMKYKDCAFELIDVPGHEELIKNMISGSSYAKFALLAISAKKGEGVSPQTKRHVFLAEMLGIKNLIVAVNKMDTVGYNDKRFKEIKEELGIFLDKIRIESKKVQFVPISAYYADNLSNKSKNMVWYGGKPLLGVMRSMSKQGNVIASDGNLRIILQGSMPHETDSLLIGNVVSGTAKVGGKVKILPIGKASRINTLFVKGQKRRNANAGENVAIKLHKPIIPNLKGSVVYDYKYKNAKVSKHLDALIFMVRKIKGDVSIKFNGTEHKGKVKIKKIIDTTDGSEKGPEYTQLLNAAVVHIKLERGIPAEPFNASKELGRFVIYQTNQFSGIGIISSVSK